MRQKIRGNCLPHRKEQRVCIKFFVYAFIAVFYCSLPVQRLQAEVVGGAEKELKKQSWEKEKDLRRQLAKTAEEAQKTQYEAEMDNLIEQVQEKDQKIQAQEKVIKEHRETSELQGMKYKILREENKNEFAQELVKLRKEKEELLAQNDKLINEKKQLLLKMVNFQKQAGAGDGAEIDRGGLEIAYEEVNYLKAEFDNLNTVLNKAYEELSAVKEQNSVMSRENEDLFAQIAELKKQLGEKEKKITLTENLMREKEREYIDKLENNKKELSEELKEFRKLAKELEKKNELTNKDKEIYVSQLEDYKNRFSALQKDDDALKKEAQTLTKQLREMGEKERNWQKKETEQTKLLTKYSRSMDELTLQMDKLKIEKQGLNLLINTMPEKLSQLERELNNARMENVTLHYNLGVFHTQRQEYTQAIEEFNSALQFNENDASSHYNLGIIYSRYIIDEAKAISHFKHYLALSPNDKDAQRAKEYLLIWGTKENMQ